MKDNIEVPWLTKKRNDFMNEVAQMIESNSFNYDEVFDMFRIISGGVQMDQFGDIIFQIESKRIKTKNQ